MTGTKSSDSEEVRRKIQQAHLNASAVHDEFIVFSITTLLNNPKRALVSLATETLLPDSSQEADR